ncbi:MAG: DUF4468 domain-containing protein [Bacteroidales bacterium]|nr:DUF4468 domain-containing protein [Bacteroidales bacterium]
MKKISFIIFIVLIPVFFSIAQNEHEIIPELTKSIDLADRSQTELYLSCVEWFFIQFNNTESVISYEDKESGLLIFTAKTPHQEGLIKYNIEHVLILRVSENNVFLKLCMPLYFKKEGLMTNSTINDPPIDLPTKKHEKIAADDRENIALSLNTFLSGMNE